MTQNNRFLALAFIMLAAIVLSACGSNSNSTNDGTSNDNSTNEKEDQVTDITIGQDPYDYAKLPVYVGKHILENRGYDVDVKEADVGILFSALADDEIDVFPDVWNPNLHGSYVEKYQGELNLIGTLYKDAPMGVAVPEYMEDINTIPDLKDHHDEFDGELYGTEAGTGMNETADETIKDYDLDYEQIESSTEGMLAQVGHKTPDEEPIAFLAWRPHIMFKEYDIKILDDPKDVWGADSVEIGVKDKLKDKSPTAYKLYDNMNFSLDEVEKWQLQLRDSDKSVDELADEWLEEHPDRAAEWLDQ